MRQTWYHTAFIGYQEHPDIRNMIVNNAADNKLNKIVKASQFLPKQIKTAVLSKAFGRIVPFVGTAGIVYESVKANKVVVSIANKRSVQNHIKGVHAVAMALIAETATGFVTALNLPSNRVLLIKSMQIDYKKIAKGSMKATAFLNDEQRQFMANSDNGEMSIPIKVTDETGGEPITVEMIWAWFPKKS